MNRRSTPTNSESNDQGPSAYRLRILIVTNPNTPAKVLTQIAGSETREEILERIAEHPRCPRELMIELANHDSANVRSALIENPNLTASMLETLSKDDCADVRYAVAESYKVGGYLLERLSEDDNPYVSYRANRTLARQAEIRDFSSAIHGANNHLANPFRQLA
jgi:hypothetical protein